MDSRYLTDPQPHGRRLRSLRRRDGKRAELLGAEAKRALPVVAPVAALGAAITTAAVIDWVGLLGLAQLTLVAGLAAALLAAGTFDTPAGLGASAALVIPWFALGYALYAVAYATAGALASRQQNADTAGQPVSYTLMAVYFGGYVALSTDANGLLSNVLTVFPVSAPLVLPARSVLVGVPLWEHVVAVVLVLGTIYALVRFAGRVYGRGLLHAGPRIDLRTAWRLGREL